MARARRQAAVIPYRIRKQQVEVALVTTTKGKRWIVPKGSVDAGERPRDAAIREAEEEAGVTGIVARRPVGRYLHVREDGRFRVDVYLMCVTRTSNSWLEDRRRERRWMRLSDAAEQLREELRPFVQRLEHLGSVAGVARSRHGH